MVKNKSEKELGVGKDYVNVHDSKFIVIDRVGDTVNTGFYHDLYKNYLSCSNHSEWREATESEIIEAFEKCLVYRYGKDWETMKIKDKHPDSIFRINDGSWSVDIAKLADGWAVWNKNGLLYRNGIWVERLEEEPKIHIKKAIKENTVIHCETELEEHISEINECYKSIERLV